jgi:hypothetical protein
MKSLAILAVVGSALAVPAREARAALAIAFELAGPGGALTRNFAVDNVAVGGVLPPGYVPTAGYTQIADTDPRVGFLGLGTVTPFAGYTVEGSLQSQTIASGAPGSLNLLDTSALSVTNDTGGVVTATVAVSGTSFRGPIQTASSSGSITWQNAVGSTINAQWRDDPQNGQGAENASDLPGQLVHSWLATADSIADADSTASGLVAVNDPAAFSMSLGFVLTTRDPTGAGDGVFARVVNRGQTEIKAVVPEPSTFAMVGLMTMAGLGVAWKRRRATA